MESAWKWVLGVALASLVLGIVAHFGATGLGVIASASAFLRFADTCLLLAILLLLAGRIPAAKPSAE